LTFFRGEWCPYCDMQLRALQKVLPEIQAQGASLVAISPQSNEYSLSMEENGGLGYPLLSDVDNKVAKEFRISHELDQVLRDTYISIGKDVSQYNADGSFTLPLAATFVIGQDGTILYSFIDCHPGRRAEPVDILNAIPPTKESNKKKRTYVFAARVRAMVTGQVVDRA
jgi:peroxiredoxin